MGLLERTQRFMSARNGHARVRLPHCSIHATIDPRDMVCLLIEYSDGSYHSLALDAAEWAGVEKAVADARANTARP